MFEKYLNIETIPVGDILKRILLKVGLPQRQLAIQADEPPQRINDIIAGKRRITVEQSLKLEKALNISTAFQPTCSRRFRKPASAEFFHTILLENRLIADRSSVSSLSFLSAPILPRLPIVLPAYLEKDDNQKFLTYVYRQVLR